MNQTQTTYRTNQIPTREKHEAMCRAALTVYAYDEVVAVIAEANAVNEQYMALLEQLHTPFDGWQWWDRVADERYNEIAAITKNANEVDTRGATRHSREVYPLSRIQKDIAKLRRVIAKLQRLVI